MVLMLIKSNTFFVGLTAHLSLPHGVANAPQSRYGKKQLRVVGMRPPYDKNPYENRMDDKAHHHQRQSSDVFHYGAEQKRTEGVHHPEADHHVSHGRDAQGTRYVGLEHRENFFFKSSNNVFWSLTFNIRVRFLQNPTGAETYPVWRTFEITCQSVMVVFTLRTVLKSPRFHPRDLKS